VSAKQKLNLVMFLFLLIYLVVSWHVGRRETHLYAPHAPKEAGAEGKGEMKDWCIAIAVEIVAASLHTHLLATHNGVGSGCADGGGDLGVSLQCLSEEQRSSSNNSPS
jgi:hypothetical protein